MGWNQADLTWIGTLVWVLSCRAIRVGQSLNLLEPWFPHLSTGQMPASHRQLDGSVAVYTHCLASAQNRAVVYHPLHSLVSAFPSVYWGEQGGALLWAMWGTTLGATLSLL